MRNVRSSAFRRKFVELTGAKGVTNFRLKAELRTFFIGDHQ
jgi:hypothetical protein